MTTASYQHLISQTPNAKLRDQRQRLLGEAPAKPMAARGTVKAATVAEMAELRTRACAALGVSTLPDGVEPRRPGAMNKWELRYAERCNLDIGLAELKSWEYEIIRLRIGVGRCFYSPDFVCLDVNGRVSIIEVKGWRWAAGIVRVKVAAKLYPQWDFMLAKWTTNGWEYEELTP
jgi:hypothetical protein